MFIYMLSTIQPYLSLLFLILCSYFHLLFLTLLATRYILLFTMFDSISLQPARNVTELTKTLYSSRRKKKCRVNYNQNKCSKHIVQSTSFASLFIHILIYGVRKTSPRKKAPPSWGVRVRVRVGLGIGLDLESGGLFSSGVILWQKNFLTIFHTEIYDRTANNVPR